MRHSSKINEIKTIKRAVSSYFKSDSHKIDSWLVAPCICLDNKSPLDWINDDQFDTLLLKILSDNIKLA